MRLKGKLLDRLKAGGPETDSILFRKGYSDPIVEGHGLNFSLIRNLKCGQ